MGEGAALDEEIAELKSALDEVKGAERDRIEKKIKELEEKKREIEEEKRKAKEETKKETSPPSGKSEGRKTLRQRVKERLLGKLGRDNIT